ncbi:MAG TPA: hypothetical protein VFQ25_14620 [Ktedonobacterales bacterium]|nr:hypothetical protein [Ktedonobacterales bacterium]
MQDERHGRCEECGTRLYQAGEQASAGEYLRVDDGSFQRLSLPADGALPASFDGRVALYRLAAASCVCERRVRGDSGARAGVASDVERLRHIE